MGTKRTILLVTTALLIGAIACNFTGGSDDAPGPAGPNSSGQSSEPQQDADSGASSGTGSDADPGSDPGQPNEDFPVPMNEGLASLNSYRLEHRSESTGPAAVDRSNALFLLEHDEESDSTHMKSDSTTHDEENPEGTSETSEYYQIGNESCTVSDGEAEFESMSPIEREISDLMASMVDFNPAIEDPVQVGEATVNGVDTWHYQFELNSLGSSGVEVVSSDGEYWMAQDGRYLVRYLLNLELREAPEGTEAAEAFEGTIEVELTDINAPVAISFPQNCLEAQSAPDDGS